MRTSQIRERGPYVMHAGNDPKPSNLFSKHLWELYGQWRRLSRALVLLARFLLLLLLFFFFMVRQEIYVRTNDDGRSSRMWRIIMRGWVPSICAAKIYTTYIYEKYIGLQYASSKSLTTLTYKEVQVRERVHSALGTVHTRTNHGRRSLNR